MFKQGKPIFLKDCETERNILAGFRQNFSVAGEKQAVLRITAHSFYRAYLNGIFVGIGPARAPYGYLRIDEIQLGNCLKQGENCLAIEVMGYGIKENNFITYESPVLAAEVESEGKILCATDEGWTGICLYQKQRDVELLGFGRRVPLEYYILDDVFTSWRIGKTEEKCVRTDRTPRYLPRGCTAPDLSLVPRPELLGVWSRNQDENSVARPLREWWEEKYPVPEHRICGEILKEKDCCFSGRYDRHLKVQKIEIDIWPENAPAVLDFALKEAETGHVGIVFSSEQPVTVDLVYNEVLDNGGHIPAFSDSTRKIIRLESPGGKRQFESFEFAFAKYLKVIVRGGGKVTIHDLYFRRDRFPDLQGGGFLCSDERLNQIYEGAKRTLLTNTLDYFMDCPQRERGGWSGDSYWTGRAMHMMCGDTEVEKTMLENFLLSAPFPGLDGTFASCCCAGGKEPTGLLFSWNLFLLYELADYCRRTGDMSLAERYGVRVKDFLQTCRRYQNQAGLLEQPPGTIFIDWSGANDKENTSPISLPTNVFYAKILREMAVLYDTAEYDQQAKKIDTALAELLVKNEANRFGLFSKWPLMADNVLYQNGELEFGGQWSEAAQYYLFWLDYLNASNAPELLKCLLEHFGPCPSKHKGTAHLSVKPAGFFFGYMIRFEMLSKAGEFEQLHKELSSLCGYMLDHGPGTYWETLNGFDSLNHGFGSHVGVVLMRDFLGIDLPNEQEKRLRIAPHPCSLTWAKGNVTLKDGRMVSVHWRQESDKFALQISAPKEYELEIDIPEKWACCGNMNLNGERIPYKRKIKRYGGCDICLDKSIL